MSHGTVAVIIHSAKEAAELFKPVFAGAELEHIAVAYLQNDRRLIAVEQFEAGEADGANLPIRSIVEDALRLGANAVVIAHNHPSGDPSPSAADLMASRALAETTRNLGIQLVDHLIFASGEFRSLRKLGLL
ncbi:MAG TPA: JAB domain-containing protein [Allosphingosinicella sp.]|jgi:DNA repair protein RadC